MHYINVDSLQVISEKVAINQTNLSSRVGSTQEMINKTVRAYTKALMHDKVNNIIYAGVIPYAQ
jgi:hypothetical protein